MKLEGKRVGFALTGSFCTFDTALQCMEAVVNAGAAVTPIISYAVDNMDTRFFKAEALKEKLRGISGREIIHTIPEAEPIGPKRMFDILTVLPVTGNSLAKLALGITDTPVIMAVKSHLRNNGPVVLGLSTNDALSNSAKNIGALMNMRNYYFVPFSQDNILEKPKSMSFKPEQVLLTIETALDGRQLQPVLSKG